MTSTTVSLGAPSFSWCNTQPLTASSFSFANSVTINDVEYNGVDTSGWLGDITLTQGAAAGDTIDFAVYPGRSIDVGAAAITLGLGDTIVVTLVTEYWDSTQSEVAAQTEESEVTLVIGENPVAGVVTEAVA